MAKVCITFDDEIPYQDIEISHPIYLRIAPKLVNGVYNYHTMDNYQGRHPVEKIFDINDRLTGILYMK